MTTTERTTDVQRHRALASSVRSRLVETVRDEPDLDTAELAERIGLHINTVRAHLHVLEQAGLVTTVAEERDRPGRPRRLYRAADTVQASSPPADDARYRLLATVLASYLGATDPDPAAAAEKAGTAWGSFVMEKPPPFSDLQPAEAIARLETMLSELGFAPRVDDRESNTPKVVLRHCPFIDVARDYPDVVCSVHLGLMRGALDELGADVKADDLIPWAQPDACVAHLRTSSAE